MPILIDGHNLIGQMDDISLSDPDDEERLIECLAAYQRRHHSQVTVVFDSGRYGGLPARPRQHASGIRILYAQPGQRADDVICGIVRRSPDRRGWLVVSSDHAVQAEVRYLGATPIPSEQFARQLAAMRRPPAPQEKEKPPSPSEVEEWLRIFSTPRQTPSKRR
jgi:predicted RNA-binding protein with PIN domain